MEPLYDYKKFTILYVDDEEMSLKAFARAYEDDFRILTAANARAGLKLLEAHKDEIGILMTDQRMPGEQGIWLLERARQLNPQILRVLATAYSDYEAAISAVNSGAIYKYISKPWDPGQLEQTLKRGLEFFIVQRERNQLLHEKTSILHNMMVADRLVSLGLLAAGLSHHIRNSLVAIKTFLDLAPAKMQEEKTDMNELRNPDFWNEYHQSVQTQVAKINNLLKDLWSASESPSFRFEDKVKLHAVLAGTIENLRSSFAAKEIQVDNQISAELPELNVDKAKFYRLFELLLKDELASLPSGSRVTLTAELHNGGSKPEILVQISDNGPGLSDEALRLMFDPFLVRGDTPAEYGINLMACFFIVYHHGGKIEARSTKGQGTTFILRLPLHPESVVTEGSQTLMQKSLLNESLWEKLVSSE